MRLYDTHCHFESLDENEIAELLRRAKAVGVEKIMAVGGSVELNESAIRAAQLGCKLAVGYDRDQIDKPRPEIAETKLSAWGEIGLDYYYSPDTRAAQLKLFGEQLEAAKRRDLPVVIHTREADDDTIALLKEIPSRGIIHCYTGTPEYAKRFLDLGFYISISGIVTFRLAENVRESALVVPDDRILIETDSPFLAPVPNRGKANEPAFVEHTCRFLADLRKMDAEEFAELTFTNAERILG